MNPCLNDGLCIQNDDLSLNFKHADSSQLVNFKSTWADFYSNILSHCLR